MAKHVFYWEDLAGLGWDIVALANSEDAAESIAKEKIKSETIPADAVRICEAIERNRPTGIFHYDSAICIFTECDPVESRHSREALAELSRQMRERASIGGTASLKRLLETRADVIDGKPDVGWAARNREDLRNEEPPHAR